MWRQARTKAADMEPKYTEKKTAYDKLAATLETNKTKLEQEVWPDRRTPLLSTPSSPHPRGLHPLPSTLPPPLPSASCHPEGCWRVPHRRPTSLLFAAQVRAYREEVAQEESRFHLLTATLRTLAAHQDRMHQETRDYVSGVHGDAARKKTYRDSFGKKILEQEHLGKHLREKQKVVKDSHEPNLRQLEMWRDLARLMDAKHAHATRAVDEDAGQLQEEDRLVL